FALMAVLVLAGSATATLAKEDGKLLPVNRADELGATNDRSLGAIQGHQRGGVVDTASYGDIGAGGFSIFDDVWDWDNPSGGGGALMGWYSTDVTQQSQAYGRRITQSIWNGHGNPATAPTFGTTGAIWIGAFEDEADDLCWVGGLGYG